MFLSLDILTVQKRVTKILLASLVLLNFFSIAYAKGMEEMIEYLSSSKLEGRKPGQAGNVLATNYIAELLSKSNLDFFDQDYFQEFTIFTKMSKIGVNSCLINNKKAEFQPISYSLNGKISNADIIFAGFGISVPKNDPNLKYDDYENVDVKDKVVAILTGDPGIGNLNSKFRQIEYQNYNNLFYKLKNAISHGARGVLIIHNPLSLDKYPHEKNLFFNNTEGGGSRFSILAGRISNAAINDFMPAGKTTWSIQKNISKTQKPESFSLNSKVNLNVELQKETGRVSNIIGVKIGNDPILKNEVIVLGAHMDHLGFGGESSMDPQGEGKIHFGADDNASGTSVVLKLAKDLKDSNLKRTYIFALFNAEEMGLLGSSYFVDNWTGFEKKFGKIVAMLNFDMVGRYTNSISLMGMGSSKEWSVIYPILKQSNINFVTKMSIVSSSDHVPFINNKTPALFFTTGAHEDYHRSTDTKEKINFTAMKELNKTVEHILNVIDIVPKIIFDTSFSSQDPSDRNRGYGAHLGCVPDFGQADGVVGVVCMRASENSPAHSAGIASGDVLVQIGTIEIKNIYDLSFALKYYRAGDEIEIAWKRLETLFKQKIILAGQGH